MDTTEPPKSRFAYHGDEDGEPREGGVRAAPLPASRKPGTSTTSAASAAGATRASNGVPGPEEKLLDISELARTIGMHYTHRFKLPAGKVDDFEAVAPIEGTITLTNSGAILLLRGKVQTILRLEDSRTLEPFDEPVEAELEEEFDLVTKAASATHRQDEVLAVDEDTPASVIENNVLNLAELLRQTLLLAAPLQPVRDADALPLGAFVYRDPDDTGELPTATHNPLRKLAALLDAPNGSE